MNEPEQTTFDFTAPIRRVSRAGTIDERFARFDAANPHVYAAMCAIARRMVASGSTRLGVKQLYEILRHDRLIYTAREEAFKLNNDFTALYARKIRANEPDIAHLFETRVRREEAA